MKCVKCGHELDPDGKHKISFCEFAHGQYNYSCAVAIGRDPKLGTQYCGCRTPEPEVRGNVQMEGQKWA